jgi:peptide subunit release factor 1 (eRF1)
MKEEMKLKKLVKELEKIKGRHTELVSVYIPSGYNLAEIVNQLVQEKSTAMNIKSKTTRKNVLAALEKILQHLKLFKVTPSNGLIIFCGNISPIEGRPNIKLWSIEPPEKMNVKLYWCDEAFVLEPLKELIREREIYGLIVLDAGEAAIGLLRGKSIEVLKEFESRVPSKTVKGGMCLYYNTEVALSNGKKIKINKIKVGEKVVSFDLEKNQVNIGECKKVFKRNLEKAYKIVFGKEKIIASHEHKFFVKSDKIEEKFVSELKKGDKLIIFRNGKIEAEKVKNIQLINIPAGTYFYDLQISPFENYFANNILVHNSQARYDRLRENAIHEFLTKVGEKASQFFSGEKDLKGVLVGGPGPIKERFAKGDYLHYEIKSKIIGVKDTSYTGAYGLSELVRRSQDLLLATSVGKERELLEKFFIELKKGGNVVYGVNETIGALSKGAIETLLISEDFNWVKVNFKCANQHKFEEILPRDEIEDQKCEKCQNPLIAEKIEDLSEILMEEAKQFKTKVELISTSTTEGKEFKEMGGIGGFLRYRIS